MKGKAVYSKTAHIEKRSITILKYILDSTYAVEYITDNDKTPAEDGYIHILDSDSTLFGKLEVQVKTLKKNSNTISYNLKKSIYAHAADGILPFLIIIVDQDNEKAYWKHLTREEARMILTELENTKKGSKVFHLEKKNEIKSNPPYKEWRSIISIIKEKLSNNETEFLDIPFDKNKHILDQTYDVFEYLFDEINFLPISLLLKQKPLFENNETYYYGYTLHNPSDAFFELIQNISIWNNKNKINESYFDGVKNVDQKISKIESQLSQNLIYHLKSSNKKEETINLKTADLNQCSCPRCQILKWNFDKIDFSAGIKDRALTTDQKMVDFFAHYKLGNYAICYSLLIEALHYAKTENKFLSQFLITYNLVKLRSILKSNIFDYEVNKSIINELNSVEIDFFYMKRQKQIDSEIVKILFNDQLMMRFYFRIQGYKNKILAHWRNSKNNGFGHNNYINELLNVYAELIQFLEFNTIIYDCFAEYAEIFDCVVEGVMASLAITGTRYSNIKQLPLWIAKNIVEYGNTNSLNRYVQFFEIEQIIIQHDTEFITGICKLFDSITLAIEMNIRQFGDSKELVQSFKRKIDNSITLVSHSKISDLNSRKFINSLLNLINNENVKFERSILFSYLHKVRHLLKSEDIEKLFIVGISNNGLGSVFIDSVCYLSYNWNKSLKMNQDTFNEIINRLIAEDNFSYCYLYSILHNEKQKEQVKMASISQLELNFNVFHYCMMCQNDLVDIEDSSLKKVVEILTPKSTTDRQERGWSNYIDYSNSLNFFINLAYQKNIDLNSSLFEGLKLHSQYYNWLLDLDGFDYSNFDPKWITLYQTNYYYRKFYKCKKLKLGLESFIKDHQIPGQSEITKVYMEIYISKVWKVE